jgi:oligopeptidase A
MDGNPFLDSSFEIHWSQLRPEFIVPAIEEALSEAQKRIDAIASQDFDKLSYENTFLALDQSTESLALAWAKVSHLQSVADSPDIREAHNKLLPKVSSFYARIPLNAGLWRRLKAFAETPEAARLQGVYRRHLEENVADFKQAGADLPETQHKRLEEIEGELAKLTQKYSENVLDATNAWQLVIEDESKLAGIPERARNSARRSAEKKGYGSPGKPAWRFTLHGPSMEPLINYADNEEVRRLAWSASISVGSIEPYNNDGLIRRILALRAEKAALLGNANFADMLISRRMARSGERALAFIERFRARCLKKFQADCAELENFKAEQLGQSPETIKAWEIGYWAEKLRKQRYDFDDELLRPYFPLDSVKKGLFEIVRRIYGVTVTERPSGSVDVWHPEVKFFDLHDEKGLHLGSFYADWHPRESKHGGAWMNYLITGGPRPDGTRAPHLGLICGNVTPPAEGHPALLTHREVETVFHEFGHLLHHLLGEVPIKSLNGVNVAWDFVELPSQIMENWCWERESLDLFARHYQTGERIPDDLYVKLKAARTFRSASTTMRQIQFAKMDLLLHTHTAEYLEGNLEERMREVLADTMIPCDPPSRTIMRRFTHVFGDSVGYAAGYYSYKWAEVLDADAFTRFRKEGIFNRATGAAFVDCILSKGNSEAPDLLYRSFMGRDPEPQALLERSGLT